MPQIQPGPRGERPALHDQVISGKWEGRARLWIVIDGHNALGPGKVRLLEAIAAGKSLAAAAKSLRMSYRLAWKHLRFIEERTGLTVVERRRGGAQGGGTVLTPQGRALLEAYRTFRRDVGECVEAACHRHFAKWMPPGPARSQLQTRRSDDAAAGKNGVEDTLAD
ncbi:MAG: LysR family transcriptional regulator [Myxococcales bacterium]|nr:MAG: LysR family transcriptional regulator [Myxococcales bacterium]